jgi:hypothetical protein
VDQEPTSRDQVDSQFRLMPTESAAESGAEILTRGLFLV